MKKSSTHVGLDVHKNSTAIAVTSQGQPTRFAGTVGSDLNELIKALGRVGTTASLKIVYEAGPCGYGLVRTLRELGYACDVIAPSKIARRPGDRVKTDRRDAQHLAEQSLAGALTPVYIPGEADEAMRDLCRAREDAVRARLKARQRLQAMLLRHGLSYRGKTAWTAAHERYLAQISFPFPAQELAYVEYRQAVSESHARVERLTASMREQLTHWRMHPVVEALMTLRGINLVAAMTLVAELGDLRRFALPRELMSFLGLVPSEHSSGDRRHQGAITRTGNGHARRMLVEAAWNYRYGARISRALQVRQEGQPQVIRDLSWQAQTRLCGRYRALKARRLHQNKVCVAIARELAGFIWAIARRVELDTMS